MWADGAADDVVGVADVCHPVSYCLIGRVLQRCRAAVDGDDLGAEEAHPVDVERLPAHVLAAHVHEASEAERGARGRGRNPVLPRSGFRDDPPLAHALREEHLAESVVQLVCTGVEQVLPLQPDLRAGMRVAEPARVGHRRRTTREFREPAMQLGGEIRVGEGAGHRCFELLERRHERLRHVRTAVPVEAPARGRAHRGSILTCAAADRAASTKRRTSSGSLSPGRRSSRLDASTPAGRTAAMASATSSGPRPPASTISR